MDRSRDRVTSGWAVQVCVGALLLLGGFPARQARAETLKVLTLNFNSETVLEDKDYRFRNRRLPAIIEWIKQNDPDIVTFDEAWNYHHAGSVVKTIAEAVGYDFNYRIGMGAPFLLYDSDGIIAKKKFHMSQRRFSKLPHGAPWLGNGASWVVVFGAISWVVGNRLTLADGSPLYVYTTHLIGGKQPDRDYQMWGIDQDIRAHIARNGEDYEKAHIILTGDFNSDPDSGGIRKLVSHGYHDTFAEAHPGSLACTNCSDPYSFEFNPLTIAAGEFPTQDKLTGNERIDYVLTHGPGMRTLASTLTFTAPVGGLWMSDHYGVTSTIQIGDAAGEPEAVANPARDSEDPADLAQVVHVTKAFLNGLESASLGEVSWARGVTFINDTHFPIAVRVRPHTPGHGQVWAQQNATLGSGRATAYFFEPGQSYDFGVTGWDGTVLGSFQSAAL